VQLLVAVTMVCGMLACWHLLCSPQQQQQQQQAEPAAGVGNGAAIVLICGWHVRVLVDVGCPLCHPLHGWFLVAVGVGGGVGVVRCMQGPRKSRWCWVLVLWVFMGVIDRL
jgi:hypothetical protein